MRGELELLLQHLAGRADRDLEGEGEGEDAEVQAGIDASCQSSGEVGSQRGVGDGDACAEESEQEGVESQQGGWAREEQQALDKAEEQRADDGNRHERCVVSFL